MKVAICEDNAADLEAISGCIENYCEKHCFLLELYKYESGEALLAAFASENFDVIFMDILLDGMSGIEAARKIRETDLSCVIVFITCSETDYAMDAYSVEGLAYVKKSNMPQDAERALDRCRDQLRMSSRFIAVPVGHQSERRVPLILIRYVEVFNKEVLFHLKGETLNTRRMKLEEVAKSLDEAMFLRCHRSYIVNMHYVDRLQNGDILMKEDNPDKNAGKTEIIPLSRKEYTMFLSAFNEFLTKKAFAYDTPSAVGR